MLARPKVSIIITTYYRNDKLKRAIEACLSQDYDNIEIFVVDDSGEGYAEGIVADYDCVEYIQMNENKGQIAAWNKCVDYISGKYVNLHDDDDFLRENKIKKQVDYLEGNSEIGSVYCGFTDNSGRSYLPEETNKIQIRRNILKQHIPCCQTTTMLTRSQLLKSIFPLQEYPAATDIALQLEIISKADVGCITECLVNRNINTGSIGSSIKNRKTRLRLIDEYDIYQNHQRERNYALARSYYLLGETLSRKRIWSAEAVRALVKSNYHSNSNRLDYIFLFFATLLGRVGILIYDLLTSAVYKFKQALKH
ncbi:glycosyltransferase family 2 protein [Haloarcula argentinensis]|uniref:Glycosyltransferase n=1 Tax=Haloarcula argentinensis TaxID=43776 RepID=A0A847UI83_HALAR|nr:glycosyltransferase family 2 protein [Haloarcula argentinensis]NLV11947.1 glycosyltransferase [Haloarcula argentinensis]